MRFTLVLLASTLLGATLVAAASRVETSSCRAMAANCTFCLENPECGWCNSQQTCVPGTQAGPNYGHCSEWNFATCPVQPTPAPWSPWTPSPVAPWPPLTTMGLTLGSFVNFSPGQVYLQFWFNGQVCLFSDPINQGSGAQWYKANAETNLGDNENFDISNCTNVEMIEVRSYSCTMQACTTASLINLTMKSASSAISMFDFAYFGGTTIVGGESWGDSPQTMSAGVSWQNENSPMFTVEGAGTWFSNVSASIDMLLVYQGVTCDNATLQGPSSVVNWHVGSNWPCPSLDRISLVTGSTTCDIKWPQVYGWTGASLAITASSDHEEGWCVSLNMWAFSFQGGAFLPSPVSGCPICSAAQSAR